MNTKSGGAHAGPSVMAPIVDYAYKDRQAFINPTPADTRARKVRLAIAELGTRYVCHAMNRVRKAAPQMPYFLRNGLDLV